jgi:hypothetical protein
LRAYLFAETSSSGIANPPGFVQGSTVRMLVLNEVKDLLQRPKILRNSGCTKWAP